MWFFETNNYAWYSCYACVAKVLSNNCLVYDFFTVGFIEHFHNHVSFIPELFTNLGQNLQVNLSSWRYVLLLYGTNKQRTCGGRERALSI